MANHQNHRFNIIDKYIDICYICISYLFMIYSENRAHEQRGGASGIIRVWRLFLFCSCAKQTIKKEKEKERKEPKERINKENRNKYIFLFLFIIYIYLYIIY